MSDLQPTFQGALWFKRWSDSSTQGVQVTFALADAEELEPLKAKIGKRFACVLVEIGDDEQPSQEPQKPRRVHKDARGPLCREACELCVVPQFQMWASLMDASDDGSEPEPCEAIAKAYILSACGVASRKEFDENQFAGEAFIERIRIPFMHWQRKAKA